MTLTEEKPRYDVEVVVFNRQRTSYPDTIILRLHDLALLSVVEKFLERNNLGVLQPLRDQPGNSYLLYRGRDAEQVAAQIRMVLWENMSARL
ncbi:MAG TPA: hypothetical protein VK003_04295 [Oceanobacillus sp.]|nr:hypothetical protein [Oceanobacillus sp.]